VNQGHFVRFISMTLWESQSPLLGCLVTTTPDFQFTMPRLLSLEPATLVFKPNSQFGTTWAQGLGQ
jgi:hypothetical protein